MDHLGILVGCGAAYFYDCLVWLGARRNNFNDLAFNTQCIPGPRWLGPCQFAAQADNAISQRQPTRHKKMHDHSGGMPSASGYSPKHAGIGCRLVKMERLWIKLLGKALDPFFSHMVRAGSKLLANVEIFQVQSFSALTGLIHRAFSHKNVFQQNQLIKYAT